MVEQALLTALCCVHFTLHSHLQEQSRGATATHQPAQKMMWLVAQDIKWRADGKDGQRAQHHKEPLQGAPTGSPLICCCLAALIVAQGCQSHAIRASTGWQRRCFGSKSMCLQARQQRSPEWNQFLQQSQQAAINHTAESGWAARCAIALQRRCRCRQSHLPMAGVGACGAGASAARRWFTN